MPCVARAYIGSYDEREYVGWAAAPYNKIVLIKGNTFSADWVSVTCAGQYVAPDIILTARHCLIYSTGYDGNQMVGEKIPIETYDGRETWVVLEKYGTSLSDDWALLRVTDGRFFSRDYFDSFPDSLKKNDARFPVPVSIAGFGWLRILTPDEIQKIHKKLSEHNVASYESAETYLEQFYDEFTTLLDGKELRDSGTYFDFSISSEVKDEVQYEIALVKDSSSTIPDEDIVAYLEKQTSGSYAKVNDPRIFTPSMRKSVLGSPAQSMILYKNSLPGSAVENYRLRLWVKEGAVITDPTATYTVEVKVYGKVN